MRHLFLLAACLLALPFQTLSAEDPDFELQMKTTFKVERDGDDYDLSSRTEVTRKYLSKRSVAVNSVSFGEQFFDKIVDMQAGLRGYHLGQRAFSFEHSPGSDVFISNLRVHTITFPEDLAQGESIWYTYNREYNSIPFLPIISIPNNGYVKEFRIVIEHPDDVGADFDFFFPRDTIPYQILKPEDDRTELVFTDVRALQSLPVFPFNDARAAIQIRLHNGTKSLTPTTIPEFAAWYLNLFDQDPKLGPAFQPLLSSELRTAASDLEKIRIIHDHIRRNIRYIADEGAMNAFVPRDPSLVLERGYGDCKDRAYLVSTIARREGLDVRMALVCTNPTPRFSGTHVSQYNHVICAYKSNGKWLFFDPTHKYCEFGNLPNGDVGAHALILDPKNPVSVVVPPPNDLASLEIMITGKLDDPKHGKATVKMRNDILHAVSEVIEKKTQLERENIISNLVTGYFNKLSFDYFVLGTQTDSLITFESTVDLSDFVVSSSSRKYLSQMPFRLIDPETVNRQDDRFPIHNPSRTRIMMTMDLDITGHGAEPAALKFGEDANTAFSSSMTLSTPTTARITYEVRHLSKEMNGKSREQYLDFCRSFLKSKKNMFVFTRKEG